MADDFEIRETSQTGLGTFARRDFAKGELVYIYPQGKIFKKAELGALSAAEMEHLNKVGEDAFELIEPPFCYINHSCDPTVEEKGHAGYARRDIAAGEEITVDYDIDAYLEHPFECHCGSAHCRKTVRGKQTSL